MSNAIRILCAVLGMLYLGTLGRLCLAAQTTKPEVDRALFQEWASRRAAVTAAAEKARRGELRPLIECLEREIKDPLPPELPHWPSSYTASELVQLSILRAISATSAQTALIEAYAGTRNNPRQEERMAIALGLAGIAGVQGEHETVLKRCLALLRDHENDFIRASAAQALGSIGLANPKVVSQIEPVLRAALKDTSGRPNEECSSRIYGKTVYLVRAQARSSLLSLGIRLSPVEGVPYSN